MPKVTITDAKGLVQSTGTGIDLTAGTLNYKQRTTTSTANTTLTAADCGGLYIFGDADGAVLTLPDSGAGNLVGWFIDVTVSVTATTNAHKVICTDTTNEDMVGNFLSVDTDSADAAACFPAIQGDGFDYFAFDGSTTGIMGSRARVTNIAADLWLVEGVSVGTGTVATPFAAT